MANVLPLYTTGLDTGIIVDAGFIHTSVSVVNQTIFTIQGLKHEYMGSANLYHKLRQLLISDNPEKIDLVTDKVIQDVMAKCIRVLTKDQHEKFFDSEEKITKMKQKLYPISNKEGHYASGLYVSYYTMVSAAEIFFSQSERSETKNMAWMILDSLLEVPERLLV